MKLLTQLIQQLELYSQRSKTRKQLLNLDDHLLNDIGLTRQQAKLEGHRYFWQDNPSINEASTAQKSAKLELADGEI